MARVDEIMAQQRPTPQGLDARAVVQALAQQASQGRPNTYTYGLSPKEVQAENAANAQTMESQQKIGMQSVQNALQQDQQLYANAMQAHQVYLQERQLALSERAAAVEAEYKKAKMAALPFEIEAAKYKADALRRQAESEKMLDSITLPLNIGGQVQQVPVLAAKAAGVDIGTALGYAKDPKARKMQQDLGFFKNQGYSDDDAFALARHSDLNSVLQSVEKQVATQLKNAEANYQQNYGTVMEGGKARPATRDEFMANERSRLLRSQLPGLSEDGMRKLMGISTPQAQGPQQAQGGVTPDLINLFLNSGAF